MQYLYLCPICLLIAAVFIFVEKIERYLVADVIKGVASAFFVLLGILGAMKSNDVSFARLVVCGLILGAIADVLLNLRYVYDGAKGKIAFLAGVMVFLLGHIAYMVACIPHCKVLPAAIVFGVILSALLLYWIFGRIEAELSLKAFGVVYIGAIVILNCMALIVLLGSFNAHWLMFFGGTLLFLVSDVVLILNTFGSNPTFAMRVANLALYYVGQLMIALSLQLPL